MRQIKLKGTPMNLTGNEIRVGDKLPAFTLRRGFTSDAAYTQGTDEGKVRVFNVLLSLDTSVCDAQTRRFNEIAASLGDDVVVVTVSDDLPPTQGRWCAATGLNRVVVTSDYFDHSFSQAMGIRVKEMGVPARSVFVVDRNGRIAYMQITDDFTQEPDYEKAVAAAKAAAANR